MGKIKDVLLQECIDVFNREDVKKEIHILFTPIVDSVLRKIYPYIYVSLIFILINFMLMIGIFIGIVISYSRGSIPI
jgi:hypothetical protein